MEKRQRVSRACDECKAKKKQCSGSHPCTLCTTRSRQCVFSGGLPPIKDPSRVAARNKKKNRILDSSNGERSTASLASDNDVPKTPAAEDATPIQDAGRLLQDVGGRRLVYVGDSASLSFLQSIRKLVEGSIGQSSFTKDSNRHRIVEASISTQSGYRHTYTLPDYATAQYLLESFFTNTAGLFEIFTQEIFMKKLIETYQNPLQADPQWLCQLNLVFSIGMQLRKDDPNPLSKEHEIIKRLEMDGFNRAESFYLAAKNLNDPACGLEDGEFPAIQSLLMMAIYMLTAAKRNTAFAYLGMSVRLAYTLGLHKEETLSILSFAEQQARRNLWQSLYVMDCFLSSSLGRPNAITSESMAELYPHTTQDIPSNNIDSDSTDLIATVKTSQIIGEILSRVYNKRKASRSVAYTLSLKFSEWMRKLPAKLHWRQISIDTSDPSLTLKRLHINLTYFHGVLLLTRPFLLYEISVKLKATQPTRSDAGQHIHPRQIDSQSPEQAFCFHGACVRSAIHTITAVHAAFKSDALPRRDPFVIYWLFSATLVVLANAFCPVFIENDSNAAIQMASMVFHSCGEVDAQARRYQTILDSFNNAIQQSEKAKEATGTRNERDIFNVLFWNESNPLGHDPTLLDSPMNQRWTIDQAILGTENDPQDVVHDNSQIAGSSNIVEESAPWTAQTIGTVDDPIDFDAIWWSSGQDNFMFADVI